MRHKPPCFWYFQLKKSVVILNGPPFSGKDAGAEHLERLLPNAKKREFKSQLIRLTKVIHGISDEQWDELYTREKKELPSDLLDGMSPRQALIKVSEQVIKPNYGKDYFGKFAAKTLEEGVNVFSDGGFVEEIVPVKDSVGEENTLVVRICREGCSFSGDSRSYLPDGTVNKMIDLHNDGTPEYFEQLEEVVKREILPDSGG